MMSRQFVFNFAGLQNNSFVGDVSQVNLWLRTLPLPALMALSRGINGISAYNGEGWGRFLISEKHVGNVARLNPFAYYMPGRFTLNISFPYYESSVIQTPRQYGHLTNTSTRCLKKGKQLKYPILRI